MRGHSITAIPRFLHRLGLSSPSASTPAAGPARTGGNRATARRITGLAALGIAAALSVTGCGGGYGPYGPYAFGSPQPDPGSDNSGRLAISWLLKGTALTPDRCQSERIDSMKVAVASETDALNQVEFINVVCGLSRYSMEHVPTGPVTVYVDAVHAVTSQRECARYAAIAHTSATTQFPTDPFQINLLATSNCP